MAATVQAQIATGAGPSNANAETGVTYGRDDVQTSVALLPIPTALGTHFSWPKNLFLDVTAAGSGTTHITNRTVAISGAHETGLHYWWKANTGAYVQASANLDVDSSSANGATPTGYTETSTTPAQYDNTSVANTVGKNGAYLGAGIGVDFLYTAGGGSPTLQNLLVAYDEGP